MIDILAIIVLICVAALMIMATAWGVMFLMHEINDYKDNF